MPPFTLSVMQYGVAALDLMVAAGVLYVLLPASVEVSCFHLLATYLLAIVAALITQVPGGTPSRSRRNNTWHRSLDSQL